MDDRNFKKTYACRLLSRALNGIKKWSFSMSIDENTAAKVAKLARIEVESQDLTVLAKEFNDILGLIEQLNEVDVEGIEPMTSVTPQKLIRRSDNITDGDKQTSVLKNAPISREGFYAVPKVVE